jgi:Rps23 Pro-64 3,4-dihydroxylase Tpa1-like proline 4-hydroxylase
MTDKQPQALWLADLIDNDLKKAAHHEEAAAELRRQHAEIERLTAALKRANSQAEHFEREWYLRGDEIERLGNLCYDYLGELTAMRAAKQMQDQKVRFKCTVVDDHHPNGVPLKQWGNTEKPVAWFVEGSTYHSHEVALKMNGNVEQGIMPLYTHPPRREWQGLTRDKRMSIINQMSGQDWVYVVDAIEAALKEQNT